MFHVLDKFKVFMIKFSKNYIFAMMKLKECQSS